MAAWSPLKPQGQLSWNTPEVSVTVDGKQVVIKRQNDEREARAFHGLTRA